MATRGKGRPRLQAVATLALCALLLGMTPTTPARPTTAAVPCDWDAELLAALAARGEHPPNWTITDTAGAGEAGGRADLDELTVRVNRDMPCWTVSSIVNHEWMHLQQARVYGGNDLVVARYGSPDMLEVVADCGSLLLGSTYVPYVERHGRDVCTPHVVAEATALIGYGGPVER